MATSLNLGFDPVVLSDVVERKGTLFLRSDHMKYGRATLNTDWHAAREAEPKDYDVSTSSDGDRDLLRATYNRIGNITDGTFPETTLQQAMREGQQLKDDYHERETHKLMVSYDNFLTATSPRSTGAPDFGYGSILPRHNPDHKQRHLETTQKLDYQYKLPWSPRQQDTPVDEGTSTTYRHRLSEFTDTADHRHKGTNIWQDYRANN